MKLTDHDVCECGDCCFNKWRCFHCDEVFTDRKLAEDHFGFSSLLMPACIDPVRGDERALNARAIEYERLWRTALTQRDEALATLKTLSTLTPPDGGA